MRQQSSLVVVLAMALLAPACSWMKGSSSSTTAKIPMMGSSTAPAAIGTVSMSSDPNGNTSLTVKVEHMAPPSRLQPNATAYVVWIVPREGAATAAQAGSATVSQNPGVSMRNAINAGRLELKPDMTGSLKTVTPFTSFDVVITPEASAFAQAPASQAVLSVRVSGVSNPIPAG